MECMACRGEIPAGAAVCMHCGRKTSRRRADGTRTMSPWVYVGIVAGCLALGVIVMAAGGI